jgi:copper(I)-binding protein
LPLMALPARACEFYTTTLTVLHPWTRASSPGDTTARVGMSFLDVTTDDWLVGAQTPVAERVALAGHGVLPAFRFAIRAGQTTVLDERGTHLLLHGLKLPLQMGREYPLTLQFERAGTTMAKLTVDYTRFK